MFTKAVLEELPHSQSLQPMECFPSEIKGKTNNNNNLKTLPTLCSNPSWYQCPVDSCLSVILTKHMGYSPVCQERKDKHELGHSTLYTNKVMCLLEEILMAEGHTECEP